MGGAVAEQGGEAEGGTRDGTGGVVGGEGEVVILKDMEQ